MVCSLVIKKSTFLNKSQSFQEDILKSLSLSRHRLSTETRGGAPKRSALGGDPSVHAAKSGGGAQAVQTDKTVYQERVIDPFRKICKSLFYYSIDSFMLSLPQKS
jgi:hypothetical protein